MKLSLFLNRELGILAFNERVLSLAEASDTPLLERLRFLCIVSSNLDEFFEIRVAGLRETVLRDPGYSGIDGMSALTVNRLVRERAQALVERQYRLFEGLLAELSRAQIDLLFRPTWSDDLRAWAREWFHQHILPVLTPVGLDPAHPFPKVLNKSLNIIVQLAGHDGFGRRANLAVVPAPRALPRVVALPAHLCAPGQQGYMLLSTMMIEFMGELFPGLDVLGSYAFRVTRNSDLFVDEEEMTNLKEALQGELPQRHLGDAVRLEVVRDCPADLVRYLMVQSDLSEGDVYRVDGPVNLVRVMQLIELAQAASTEIYAKLTYPPLKSAVPVVRVPGRKKTGGKRIMGRDVAFSALEPDELFEVLARQDVLLHHPFDSFEPTVAFLRACVADPAVLAIKQTVYRTGQESEMMELLMAAARAGKEVTAVVELMARFDEETNINWAARLESAGVHVVYGVVGHKTHAKMLLAVRREAKEGGGHKLVRYAHVGTGNYHARTARSYTDWALLTSATAITADVGSIFMQLTGPGKPQALHALWQSPFTLHSKLIEAIRHETKAAKAGKRARIIAKMNALLEPAIIEALYAASQAGVKVDLIVRGACALRPGVAGLSANITVRSVVGRFLEHSRIFYFYDGGREQLMLSSADWMDRNFFRRIEIATPVTDVKLKKQVIDQGLMPYLVDSRLAWKLDRLGKYSLHRENAKLDDAQDSLVRKLLVTASAGKASVLLKAKKQMRESWPGHVVTLESYALSCK
jgi:polyphosphate kinase